MTSLWRDVSVKVVVNSYLGCLLFFLKVHRRVQPTAARRIGRFNKVHGAMSKTCCTADSDVNKTFCQDQDQDQDSGSQDQDQDQDLHIFSRPRPRPRPRPRLFSSDQDQHFFFQDQDQDQDFTQTTEQVTISWSQNEQNSIHVHTTRIAVYEIKTVGLM